MKHFNVCFFAGLFALGLLWGCETEDTIEEPENGEPPGIVVEYGEGVSDVEGNEYPTVIIGQQEWMAKNLATTRYRNGAAIENPVEILDWRNNTEGGYTVYDNDIQWKFRYGLLYNWHAVNNSGGLCPAGWRVPSDEDWTQLTEFIISRYEEVTEANAGNFLRSCRQEQSPLGGDCDTGEHPRWSLPAYGNNHGTDDFGFGALPGGIRRYYFADFRELGNVGFWWSSTDAGTNVAPHRRITSPHGMVYGDDIMDYSQKNSGFSVRCVRNAN